MARGVTQVKVGEALGVSQVNVSRIEHENDLYLPTLSTNLDALGGHLELAAAYPDPTNRLAPTLGPSPDQERHL